MVLKKWISDDISLCSAWISHLVWERHTVEPEPIYHNHIFIGANGVPIYGKYATPKHPKGTIIATNPEAVARVNSIQTFAHELAIENLGFNSVEDYYQASAPLNFLPHVRKPTLIIYAANDPMFDPTITSDLDRIAKVNQGIKLILTKHGGHVSYMSSKRCQEHSDRWWAWNRVLEWIEQV